MLTQKNLLAGRITITRIFIRPKIRLFGITQYYNVANCFPGEETLFLQGEHFAKKPKVSIYFTFGDKPQPVS